MAVIKLKHCYAITKYHYKKEYSFNDLTSVNGHLLRFDFYVDNGFEQYLIEFDGKQHYYPVEFWGGVEGLKDLRFRDNLKNQYCKDHNIPLIRIPYWHYKALNIDDLKLDTTTFRVA